jgi:toxin HigB-1
MIRSFKDQALEALWSGGGGHKYGTAKGALLRKLDMLNAANQPRDLRAPPGNRLERLKGDREGQFAIRVNDQWRLCFRWAPEGPTDVECVDYH